MDTPTTGQTGRRTVNSITTVAPVKAREQPDSRIRLSLIHELALPTGTAGLVHSSVVWLFFFYVSNTSSDKDADWCLASVLIC